MKDKRKYELKFVEYNFSGEFVSENIGGIITGKNNARAELYRFAIDFMEWAHNNTPYNYYPHYGEDFCEVRISESDIKIIEARIHCVAADNETDSEKNCTYGVLCSPITNIRGMKPNVIKSIGNATLEEAIFHLFVAAFDYVAELNNETQIQLRGDRPVYVAQLDEEDCSIYIARWHNEEHVPMVRLSLKKLNDEENPLYTFIENAMLSMYNRKLKPHGVQITRAGGSEVFSYVYTTEDGHFSKESYTTVKDAYLAAEKYIKK